MIEALATYLFFPLNRSYECFWLTNFTMTLLSCPLPFFEIGSLWQHSICFSYISNPQSLQILITVFSRLSSGMLLGMPDVSVVSTAILFPIRLFFLHLFLQFIVNIFYNHDITQEFLILCSNLIHAFCKSFNLFTESMYISIDDKFSFKIQDILNQF